MISSEMYLEAQSYNQKSSDRNGCFHVYSLNLGKISLKFTQARFGIIQISLLMTKGSAQVKNYFLVCSTFNYTTYFTILRVEGDTEELEALVDISM